MKHRLIIIALFVSTFLGCTQLGKNRQDSIEIRKKPNIVFIFTDDQSFKAIHALGNEEILTPTMDKLVHEGVTFTHAFNMGGWNGAICLASRAMMISGRSIWRAQEISKAYSQDNALDKTWPRLMQTQGYDTYMTGKWHVQAKPEKIFNHVGHVLRGMPFDTPEGYDRPKDKTDTLWKPWKKEFGGYWKGGTHWSELVKQDALFFLDSAAQKKEPFFMYVAFNAPHDPRQSPKAYVDQYPLEKITVPKSYLPEYPYAEIMGAGQNLRDEKLAPFPRTEYAVKVNRQEYYAITTHLDDQIKAILNALEDFGLMDNTYIFFTSDHGLSVGEHGLMGKQNMYDHSIRVPLMMVGPDLPKNKKVDADVYLQDIMATALDIAGVQKPEYIEFNSLLNLIEDQDKKSKYNGIYGVYEASSQRMIRKDHYKLILYPNTKQILLYNLKYDPLELNNIATDKKNRALIKTLFNDLITLQKEKGDSLDLKSIYNKVIS
ncbi:sulfatase-like hydrolase/transferase [Aestuariivivens sediminis]|uniref:sulfatase-like hydrolase/transferase n=1 Tax=Aestuariivivens sediminis TaxID=2913557 RepID=UPI001F571569|nr:sulfatase-like hydrolase/transferase [Aestuariivivens sediminis]